MVRHDDGSVPDRMPVKTFLLLRGGALRAGTCRAAYATLASRRSRFTRAYVSRVFRYEKGRIKSGKWRLVETEDGHVKMVAVAA
jgi:hypothetical protein